MIYDRKDNDIISQCATLTKVYDEQVKLYVRTRESRYWLINVKPYFAFNYIRFLIL